jgi:hypothetical protein
MVEVISTLSIGELEAPLEFESTGCGLFVAKTRDNTAQKELCR